MDESGERKITLQDYHARLSALQLNSSVPEQIVIQFETSKNIYLYAWFVYRFYPVVDQHVLSVLELALRERLGSEIPENSPYRNRGRLYLRSLLRYCIDHDLLKDEHFESARQSIKVRAWSRHLYESIERMERDGLTEMAFDESKIQIQDVDRDIDYVSNLKDSLPGIRNAQAHGSTRLDRSSFGTLKIVSEILNQLWP